MPAPTPPPSLNVRFGVPNPLRPSPSRPTPPVTPSAPASSAAFAAKYSQPNAFPAVDMSRSVFLRPQPTQGPPAPTSTPGPRFSLDSDVPAFDLAGSGGGGGGGGNNVVFGGGPAPAPGWGPFGTAWSDRLTDSEELRNEGVGTPAARGVFGMDVYLRGEREVEERRATAEREEEERKAGWPDVGSDSDSEES